MNYILDFYCHSELLAIEIDGAHHFTEMGKWQDRERDQHLKILGIETLRFTNSEVLKNVDVVLARIARKVSSKRKDD